MSARKAYQSTPSGRQYQPKINARSQKLRRGRSILIGLGLTGLSLVSAVAGAILAISWSVSSPLQQAELTPEQKAVFSQEETVAKKNLVVPELSRPVNILVLGIKVLTSDLNDSIPEDLGYHALVNSFDGLSDTILLLRFDPERDKLTVLSIPRDTKIRLEGYGEQKINTVNDFGGPALTAAAVSELLGGITIDRYVRVNVQGVEKLIDALGGVTVDVPKDMKYTDFSQHLYINLKKGRQHLDGDKAVQFLRFRYDAYGDISRVQRQQMLMRSVVEQTLQPSTIFKIPEIFTVIQSHIDTNLTVKELMALGGFASSTKRSDVQMLMLPGDFSGDGRTEVSYWLPNPNRIQQLIGEHFDVVSSDYQLTEGYQDYSKIRIAIQDSVDNPEGVQAMVESLQQAGYGRIYVSEAWHKPLRETKIIAQSGDDRAAASLRHSLGMGEVLVDSTGVLDSDVTIQIGKDWQVHRNKSENDPVYPNDAVNHL